MKIYLYCPESGVYQGEDFADKGFMKRELRELPAGCTAIAPPPFGRGEVPVFRVAENLWEVRHLTVPKQELSKEETITLPHTDPTGVIPSTETGGG